ncbi:MAG: virulence factor family protein [Solimonas sp.]
MIRTAVSGSVAVVLFAACAAALAAPAGEPMPPPPLKSAKPATPAKAAKAVKPAPKAPREIPLAPGAEQMLSHGRFEGVAMYPPKRQVKSFVFLMSGAKGWTAQDAQAAESLAERGALVAGIDTAQLYDDFEHSDDACLYAEGDFENLSRYIQAYYKIPGYFPPILVGEGTGASLAYMLAAQTHEQTFSGAISLGFCPLTGLKKQLCKGQDLRYASPRSKPGLLLPAKDLHTPWTWIDAGIDASACAVKIDRGFPDVDNARRITSAASNRERLLEQTYDGLAEKLAPLAAAAPPSSLSDLPLIEIPSSSPGDAFAVLISGDGGWADLDKDVADALKAHGIPVVGVDSLRYFWTERTPASTAKDVDRIVRYYANAWKRGKVLLIGYSQGANVLPFAVNRLPPKTRDMVAVTALMGLGERADFEFHLSNWVSSSDDGLPIAPEMVKLTDGNPLCIYGEDEDDSLCPSLDPKKIKLVKLPGGHHFDGNYDHLARIILETAGVTAPK